MATCLCPLLAALTK